MSVYTVKVLRDPTGHALMRWEAKVYDERGHRVTSIYCAATRKSAERQARKYIRRLRDERRAYTFEVQS